MSSLPEMNLEVSEYLCPIDPSVYESWPLLQNIEELAVTQHSISETAIYNCERPALATVENGGAAAAPPLVQPQPRRLSRQNKSNNSKTRKIKYSPVNEDLKDQKRLAEEQSADEEGTSVAKKMNHNAKGRIRRMKLNASYLALRALLLDYSRS
ncbi:transcription factor bHLH101-like [Olea europaea subsp. europaea]|uniref:Transcription factor bHLH101-like n=1 Tax=Olea europaea subsp. europaea TaxID=158383 RepID=A0A8S0RBF3_OLEEU|nr:transcription factor bHLH101-like [Olea europaea subsp. europaea]